MRRRDFIKVITGSAVTWPLAAGAQSVPPMIGYLAEGKPEVTAVLVAAVCNGIGEIGLVEGKDYISEFRSAGGDAYLLPGLATELVQHRSAVIMTLDTLAAARAAKAVTTAVPIVFATGADPVRGRLVESLNHPSGNITGISAMNLEIASKWVGLLHELLPAAKRIAILVNIENADVARVMITDTQEAAFSMVCKQNLYLRAMKVKSNRRLAAWAPGLKRSSFNRTWRSNSRIARNSRRSRFARNCRRSLRPMSLRKAAG